MVLCKCGHEQSKHVAEGCVGCAARCKSFEEAVITGAERVRRQEIIAAKLRQAQDVPRAKTIEEDAEPVEAPSEPKTVTKEWVCYDCDEGYETKKEAQDCCGSEEAPSVQWVCDGCSTSYETKSEAEECTCEDSEAESESGTGLGMGGIVKMMMGLVMVIIAVSVAGTVISSIQPVMASSSSPTVSSLTPAVNVALNFLPIIIAVVVLLGVVSFIMPSVSR